MHRLTIFLFVFAISSCSGVSDYRKVSSIVQLDNGGITSLADELQREHLAGTFDGLVLVAEGGGVDAEFAAHRLAVGVVVAGVGLATFVCPAQAACGLVLAVVAYHGHVVWVEGDLLFWRDALCFLLGLQACLYAQSKSFGLRLRNRPSAVAAVVHLRHQLALVVPAHAGLAFYQRWARGRRRPAGDL